MGSIVKKQQVKTNLVSEAYIIQIAFIFSSLLNNYSVMKLCKHDGQQSALQVSPQGIETAKKVLKNYSLTQKS